MTAQPLPPGDDRELVAKVIRRRLHAARADAATCCETVLRDEQTGNPILLAPMHHEWHTLLNAERKALIWSHVEAGKTSQVSVGRTLFELGRNPNLRVVVLANAHSAAAKIVRLVKQYVEGSDDLHRVFPHLKPGSLWTQSALTVERSSLSKDPSVQALGIHGDVIGARIDLLILDDVLDYENTRTHEQRVELREWILQSLMGRLTEDARVWALGNAYYRDDAYHWLAEQKGYVWRKYAVADAQGNPAWPAQWSRARILDAEDRLGGAGSAEAMRQLYCVPRSDTATRCKQEWIDAALERGQGLEQLATVTPDDLAEWTHMAGGTGHVTTHTGVDLGVKRHKRAGKTCLFTILSYPNGDREVVKIRNGKWQAGTIVTAIEQDQACFTSTVHVEDNGAQDFVLQFVHDREGVPRMLVLPFHTGGNKTHPVIGVESIFAELSAGRWIIPSVEVPAPEGGTRLVGATEEIREWIAHMLDYSPDAHTPDDLMACWFAKEGARLESALRREVGVRILGVDQTDSNEVDRLEAAAKGRTLNGDKAPPPVRPELEGWQPLIGKGRMNYLP